jgi:3-dehydroquinate dehydratase / shikimate dehydrogenase
MQKCTSSCAPPAEVRSGIHARAGHPNRGPREQASVVSTYTVAMTFICVSIFVDAPLDVPHAIARGADSVKQGARMIEWRLDALAEHPEGLPAILELLEKSPAPCIATIRAEDEGGTWDGDEQTRISILEAMGVSDHPPAYFDLELAAWQRSANLRQKVRLAVDHAAQVRDISARLVLSSHDFGGRPANLLSRVADMIETEPCAVGKIVFTARSIRDNLEMFDLLAERQKPMIALCMGEFGEMSRILAPKFGGFLTFAASETGGATAPGQLTVRQLRERFRFDHIGPSTRVYGVIGHPVAHSLGPLVHNQGFEAVGVDAVYIPLPVLRGWESFKASLLELIEHPRLDFSGCSVTLPHKEHLLRFVQEAGGVVDETARRIGAANTLAILEDGSLACSNTDAHAAVESLAHGMGKSTAELHGARVAIFGAGGVARAVTCGLLDVGARVVIFNRTRSRANAIRDDFKVHGDVTVGRDIEDVTASDFDALINGTSVGMDGGDGAGDSVLPRSVRLDGSVTVMDTVYAPRMTPLLAKAEAEGARVIDGSAMFIAQAESQFKIWTGVAAPAGLFASILSR